MKVLWIVTDILEPFSPYVKGKPTRGGSWISPLFFNLAKDKDVELGVIVPIIDGHEQKEIIDNISYFSVPIKAGDTLTSLTNKVAEMYVIAIKNFQPDIIHIHGIEKNYGQIRRFVDEQIPIVCSIQGIINSCYPYLKSSASDIGLDKYKSIKNRLGRGGFNILAKYWVRYMPIEQEIVKLNHYFIGRTSWDKAQLLAMNPEAYYFQGEELLRDVFYNKNWNLENCVKHQIFVPSSAYPLKGFHVVLKAVALLKKKYQDIELITPLSSVNLDLSFVRDLLLTEDYGRYLRSEIHRLGLENCVRIFKKLSDEEMATCFSNAHVFVLPSFIENSPNSLGEAMMIGTPTVVTPVGGIMSIVKDGESTLMAPSGDHAYLAYQIDRIFSNDKLASNLSASAKKIAKVRHCISSTVEQYILNYQQIIKINNESYTHTT